MIKLDLITLFMYKDHLYLQEFIPNYYILANYIDDVSD